MVSSIPWESSKCNLVTSYGDDWGVFSGVCMRLELKRINLMGVQNSIVIGEIFQSEVSDGLVHQLGSCQNINLHPARVFTSGEFLGV